MTCLGHRQDLCWDCVEEADEQEHEDELQRLRVVPHLRGRQAEPHQHRVLVPSHGSGRRRGSVHVRTGVLLGGTAAEDDPTGTSHYSCSGSREYEKPTHRIE